jgi:hypothetical protein
MQYKRTEIRVGKGADLIERPQVEAQFDWADAAEDCRSLRSVAQTGCLSGVKPRVEHRPG